MKKNTVNCGNNSFGNTDILYENIMCYSSIIAALNISHHVCIRTFL